MMMKVLAYKDVKLNVFTQPFYLGNIDNSEVIESVRRMCVNLDESSSYFDYDLYLLGIYDDKLGTFTCNTPEYLVSLGDFKHLSKKEKVEEVAKDD